MLTLLLGLAQIFFEDVLLFVATTNDGVSGVLADPMVAIAVPMTIALLMIVLLVGGAIVAPDDPRRRQRRRDRFDPRVRAGDEADGDSTTTDTERDAEESRSGPASGEGSRHRDG